MKAYTVAWLQKGKYGWAFRHNAYVHWRRCENPLRWVRRAVR